MISNTRLSLPSDRKQSSINLIIIIFLYKNQCPRTRVYVTTTMPCIKEVLTQVNETTLIARFMGPTWDPPGTDRTQVGPSLATWTLLYGQIWIGSLENNAIYTSNFLQNKFVANGHVVFDVDITVEIAYPCLTSRYDFENSGWPITDKRQIQNGHDYILLDGTVDVSMDAGTLSYSYLITRPFTLAPSFNLSWYLTTLINPRSDLVAILPPKTYLIWSKLLMHFGIWAVVGSDKVSVSLFLEQRISNKKNKYFFWSASESTAEQTIVRLVIWDVTASIIFSM